MHAIKTVFEKLPSKHLWSNLINKSRIVMAITIPLLTKLPWPEVRKGTFAIWQSQKQTVVKEESSFLPNAASISSNTKKGEG